jgi:hypothetical protein
MGAVAIQPSMVGGCLRGVALRQHLLAQQGSECVWCGRPLAPTDAAATVDHLLPRRQGGPRVLENLVVSCARCNRLRGCLPAVDWLWLCEHRGRLANREVVMRALQELASRDDHHGNRARRELRQLKRPVAAE